MKIFCFIFFTFLIFPQDTLTEYVEELQEEIYEPVPIDTLGYKTRGQIVTRLQKPRHNVIARQSKKNITWNNSEKDTLINYVMTHPFRSYTRPRSIREDMSGLAIPGKTAGNIVQQAMYMFRRVKEIYKSRLLTDQGSTGEEVATTYGYDKLLPLIRSTIPIPPPVDASREGDLVPEPAQTLAVEVQRQSAVNDTKPQKNYTTAPNPSIVTRAPGRSSQNTSFKGLIVAADEIARSDQLAIERGRLKVAEAKVQLKSRSLDIEEKRMKMEFSLEERRMEKKFALAERRMALEEKKLELERRRLDSSLAQI